MHAGPTGAERGGMSGNVCLPCVKRDQRSVGVAVAEGHAVLSSAARIWCEKSAWMDALCFGVPRFDREHGALPRDACPLLLTYRCPITLRP